jgi:hypothetical protein
MRKLSSIEKGALILSAVFVIAGTASLIYPMEGYLFHPTESGGGTGLPPAQNAGEVLTKRKSRVYGGMAIVFGIGMGWFTLRRHTD